MRETLLINSSEITGDAIVMGDVKLFLSSMSALYPDFDTWYEGKVLPGLSTGERSLLIERRSGMVAGIAILKRDAHESKLCCLRVAPQFANAGIGVRLFEQSMDVLDTRHPLLTVAEDRLAHFERLFQHFGYQVAQEYPDLYRPRVSEIAFNGLILPNGTHS